ncbi:pep-cterm family integral membrane protein [Leptolyngbya sp. Heron Island J]|uniref:TIGR02921 family PEP-CTERM protein n=1 Tax=Leptolyngbya sp. Heron Island J TaxID=1385935 RepID=UPI0003B9CFE1|nr:TIGR02921 family PEP-CTERM protein [Leptolyngbya sp. Heron Island J]ESA35927.1 pep-cterm family integral membrane protein [Leptolyngbya sp. Heron Island J]
MKTALHWLSHAIFWTWNIAFIGLVYFWLLPVAGLPILEAARLGMIPPAFVASILGMLTVPLICAVVGGKWLRKHPILLMRLFYGVEVPLFGLCLLRLFLIRETTPASAHILLTVLAAIAIFAIETLAGYAAYRPRLAWVQMIGHSLMLVTGLYAGALLLLYTVPALCVMVYGTITGLLNFDWGVFLQDIGRMFRYPQQIIIGLFFIVLWGLSAVVLVSMPYVMVNFYLRSWHRIRRAFAKQHGHGWTTTGVVVGLSCVLFGLLQLHQPQAKAFSLLEGPAPQTSADRLALVKQSETIRKGLVHGYLFRYRYLGTAEESNQLREMYKAVFNMPEADAQVFQDIHNGLLSPFLYKGDRNDDDKAETLYASFFDTPIQKAERATIRQSLQATANRDEMQAGVLNLDQKVIRLAEQTVTVAENGDWAELEIYEQYENKTADPQEIFYSFSLPESATITGLWLGETPDGLRFPFTVSPRGAAQQVYKGEIERAETQRAEDPALLEQVGPQQYRLRVFPIPAAVSTKEPGKLHLWMTYQVPQQNGAWPLPQLTEKRNIFWNDTTVHQRRGKTVAGSEDTWFEPTIQAQKKAKPTTHQVQLDEGYQVTATPVAQTAVPSGKTIAAILDTSYSMDNGAYGEALQQLETIQPQNTVDIYLATATGESLSPSSDLNAFDPVVPYGSLQPAEMLQQFSQQQWPKPYDAILLLTDAGSYELTEAEIELPELSAPLWLVHMNNQLPAAYDDTLLEAIQASGGGVATEITAVLQRLDNNVIDGYEWSITANDGTAQADDFAPVAARQMILHRSRTADMTQIENLDAVHAVAKRTQIVTPYSSMLVLVNDRQRELLRQAEAAADRFDREVEDGQDALSDPSNPLNSVSVPEPGSVIGMAAIAAGLILLKRKQSTSR